MQHDWHIFAFYAAQVEADYTERLARIHRVSRGVRFG